MIEVEAVLDDEKDAKRVLNDLRGLAMHPGWVYLKGVLERQIQVDIATAALTPTRSLDEALPREYDKGKVAAMVFLKGLLDSLIEVFETQIALKESESDEK